MDAVFEFERHEKLIHPDIAETLATLGKEAIAAYGSLHLRHNTLSTFVPRILEEGLRADSTVATPDEKDVTFAEELFKTKGSFTYDPNAGRRFDRYIKGIVDERQPGVFFYTSPEDQPVVNSGYGMPERMYLLMAEMQYVMKQDRFSEPERHQAEEIFTKYKERMYGENDAHRAILEANPFSPPIINQRLHGIKKIAEQNNYHSETLVFALRNLDNTTFEGIYVPEDVPADDLTLLPDRLDMWSLPAEISETSRYYLPNPFTPIQ